MQQNIYADVRTKLSWQSHECLMLEVRSEHKTEKFKQNETRKPNEKSLILYADSPAIRKERVPLKLFLSQSGI